MATQGNYRNGGGTQFPSLMTSMDGTYQVGVLIENDPSWHSVVFKRTLSTGAFTTFDLNTVPALVTYGITPVLSDALGGDNHYGLACAIDSQNRTWVAGNSLSTTPHLIVSGANTISSGWTTFSFPYPGWGTTGDPTGTYNYFVRMADGRLVYFFSQRDPGGPAEGADFLGHLLPATSTTTWQPLTPNAANPGEFLTSEPATGPERVYMVGAFVEGPHHPHPDRVWVAWVWRFDWTDGATQHEPGIMYNDTVADDTTWKRIDGTSQPMPISYANTTGTSAVIPEPGGAPYWFCGFQITVDFQGHPHLVQAAGTSSNHVWHTGSAWTSEACASSSFAPSPFTLPGGQTMISRHTSGRIRVSKVLSGNPSYQAGPPVDAQFLQPYYDPIQAQKGVWSTLIPDGNTPHVEELGNHFRGFAS